MLSNKSNSICPKVKNIKESKNLVYNGNRPRSNKHNELMMEEKSCQINLINILQIELQMVAVEQM